MELEFHPVAGIFPMMEGEEYRNFLEDIRQHGLREPVVIDRENKILDGRNRYRASQELGITPEFRQWDGKGTPLEYVISVNLHRRHLNESQRAMIAERLANMPEGRPSKTMQICTVSRDDAGKLLNVSTRSISSARTVREHGTPSLTAAVESGHIAVADAVTISRHAPESQNEIVRLKTTGEAKSTRDAQRIVRNAERTETPLPADTYTVIYADPPWQYGNVGLDNYGHAERHYDTLSLDELCALDIKGIAADNAVLFLWVTSPQLEAAFPVIKAWGFTYKSSFVWDKVSHHFGYYNSVRHEFLLICTRGACTPQTKELIDSVVSIERTKQHSEKPERFREIIDTLYPQGKRIELFARKPTVNWDVWGDQAGEHQAG